MDNECVVGARLRKLPAALKKQVLDPDAYGPLEGSQSRRVGEWEHKGRRLIVVWCPERARKDAHERRKAVERLLDKLERSDNPKELLSQSWREALHRRRGRRAAHRQPGEDRRSGTVGRVGRRHHQSARRERHPKCCRTYHGLWQVEESFRITKHDLRVRPIWHWTPGSDPRPHRHLLHGLRLRPPPCLPPSPVQKRRMSPEVIRSALVHRQCSILRCQQTGNRYVIPSKPTPKAEMIYATMGLPLTTTPYQLA